MKKKGFFFLKTLKAKNQGFSFFFFSNFKSYHDEHELNPLIDNFLFFSKNIHRIVLIRLVLENWRSQLSLGCFPIEFGQFFMFLCDFEKNRYFGGMAKLLYTGSQTCAPLTKSKTSTRPTFRLKYFLLCVKWHSNFLPWIAWNPGILRSMLKKFLQRLETFLGHFEVILLKSQKPFLRRHQVLQDGKMSLVTKSFFDLNKITSQWSKKAYRRCRNFLSIPFNIFGSQVIHCRKFEGHPTHRRKYHQRKVGHV